MLGAGLAMDAFAVSMTNGLNEPKMRFGKAAGVAGTFAFFQALMPLIGWLCVTLVANQFTAFVKWIPYIALCLLLIVGGKMLFDGIKSFNKEKAAVSSGDNTNEQATDVDNAGTSSKPLTLAVLLTQAVATSIDALSTGFTLSDVAGNAWWQALISVAIIGVVTLGISLAGVFVGKKFGDKLGGKAEIVGGVILIAIGIEIFVSSVFF